MSAAIAGSKLRKSAADGRASADAWLAKLQALSLLLHQVLPPTIDIAFVRTNLCCCNRTCSAERRSAGREHASLALFFSRPKKSAKRYGQEEQTGNALGYVHGAGPICFVRVGENPGEEKWRRMEPSRAASAGSALYIYTSSDEQQGV